ncbi:MAG: hypothetical protein A3F84_00425 [Candidatus Handelsmanbacteria bacterium RIFCSPLOWO2_12_FULL_64_10]|uniref:Sigma-54 factor interaction domain-containing protein n=1 Tax=Handelsmanbacteria sp. (strain RIFCSPLOWO2_12_FULL_64_10) TaxID=1817868 RepID=A0A1F6CT12_HANXR|nr:MAG: hypothetical protein A3F84_00425 [Candidatus Handelsmanbacteria bacterium RIFCSPLOWO2_12_FULL_64_10]
MYAARRKVLTMVHEHKLTVDEGEELLDAMEMPRESSSPAIPRIELIGESEWNQQFLKTLDKIAATQSPVLIQGETGTGKELIARRIHYNSRRARGPFMTLSCATLTGTLLESELFGHERGAFTGATQTRKGLLEAAHGGTLFLDAIEALPPETQIRLCSFLQNGYFTRVGGTRPVYADVRVAGATHQDLKWLVDHGKFRSDLYYRLSVSLVQAAPLRERREDIPVLAEYFVQKQAERDGRRPLRISDEAMKTLHEYPWPGNVAQLANVIEKALVLCDGDEITPEHLALEKGAQGAVN